MKTIKNTFIYSYLQTITYFRIKEAFFFAFVFPVFIFILFGYIWGATGNAEYAGYLLTGVIGMTITSDAMFGIGPVIRSYRDNNLLKFLKNLPSGIMTHFVAIFLSRIYVMLASILTTCIMSALLFDYAPGLLRLFLMLSGVILGTFMFAFLSLVVSYKAKAESGRGLLNFVFFIMLFLSGTFFPVHNLGRVFEILANSLPLTHLLRFMRGDDRFAFALLSWILVFGVIFYFTVNHSSEKR